MLSSFLTGCTWGDCAFQVEHRLEWLHKIKIENIKRYYHEEKKGLNLGPLPLLDQLLIDHVVIKEEVVETFVKKLER